VTGAADRVDALYDATLQPRIAALEALRLSVRDYIVKSGTLLGVPAAIFVLRNIIGIVLPAGWSTALAVVSVIAIFVGVVISATRYLIPGMTAYANYTAKFKQDVVAEIFKVVCPTAESSRACQPWSPWIGSSAATRSSGSPSWS
jgi:hypothetical protein